MSADIRPFGTTSSGQAVQKIRLTRGELTVAVLTWGAVLQDVRLAGAPWSLTLGGEQMAAYEGGPMGYMGAIVGPVANRIAGASAVIAGKTCRFEANEAGITTLHGGRTGTQAQVWTIADASATAVTLQLALPDRLGGFPGNRRFEAVFVLSGTAALTLTSRATTDAPTLINLTNHSYWALDGSGSTSGHRLRVAADRYLPVDDRKIPRGGPVPVEGTVFDLRRGRALDQTEGYDHNFCLADGPGDLRFAAELTGAKGVRMTLDTTEPGLQIYDGSRLNTGAFPGHAGQPYGAFAGIALEPQHWPDAPNRPDFATVALAPGQTRVQAMRWSFARG